MSKQQITLPNRRKLDAFIRVAIQGRSPDEVARELGLHKRSVETMVAYVRTWMRKHGAVWQEIDERIRASTITCELYLARLEHQWEELMNAWHRSKEPQETKKGRFNPDKTVKYTEVSTRTQTGDVSYLVQAQKLLDTITQIRLQNPSLNQENNRERLASIERRRFRLDQILKLYGPGGSETGSGGTATDESNVIDSPPALRAA